MVIFEKKHSDTRDLPMIELIKMVGKHNTLITMKYEKAGTRGTVGGVTTDIRSVCRGEGLGGGGRKRES